MPEWHSGDSGSIPGGSSFVLGIEVLTALCAVATFAKLRYSLRVQSAYRCESATASNREAGSNESRPDLFSELTFCLEDMNSIQNCSTRLILRCSPTRCGEECLICSCSTVLVSLRTLAAANEHVPERHAELRSAAAATLTCLQRLELSSLRIT